MLAGTLGLNGDNLKYIDETLSSLSISFIYFIFFFFSFLFETFVLEEILSYSEKMRNCKLKPLSLIASLGQSNCKVTFGFKYITLTGGREYF